MRVQNYRVKKDTMFRLLSSGVLIEYKVAKSEQLVVIATYDDVELLQREPPVRSEPFELPLPIPFASRIVYEPVLFSCKKRKIMKYLADKIKSACQPLPSSSNNGASASSKKRKTAQVAIVPQHNFKSSKVKNAGRKSMDTDDEREEELDEELEDEDMDEDEEEYVYSDFMDNDIEDTYEDDEEDADDIIITDSENDDEEEVDEMAALEDNNLHVQDIPVD